jgi:hypothetical protein
LVSGDLSRIPVFVRAGGFLPTEVDRVLTVHVFPRGSGSFSVYEDDGVSSDGVFHVTTFRSLWAETGTQFEVKIESSGEGSAIPANRTVVLRIHHISGDASVSTNRCEVVGRPAVANGVLSLKVKIISYPATLMFTRQQFLVNSKRWLSHSEIYDLILCSSLNVTIKDELFAALRQCKQSPAGWATTISDQLSVPPKYRELLYGELCDFGTYHFTREMGKNVFVAWNTACVPVFTYASHFGPGGGRGEHQRASGVVPSSLIYEVENHKSHYDSHIPDLATRKSRLEFQVLGISVFPVDFDRL